MKERKCPFCGHKLELEREFLGEKVYRCSNCGSEMCFGNDMEWKSSEVT